MKIELDTRKKSWFRLCLEKIVDDHGWPRVLLVSCLLVSLFMFSTGWLIGSQSPSLGYAVKAYDVFKLQLFGGQIKIARARNIFEDMSALSNKEYDRLDIIATSLYVTSTGFEDTITQTIANQGQVRIAVLDPEFAFSHPEHFKQLAEEFGNTPEQLLAECWLTLTALKRIEHNLVKVGLEKRFDVRLYQQAQTGQSGTQLIRGRHYARYVSGDPAQHLDVIVPYNNPNDIQLDSPLRAAFLIKNRINDPRIKEYRMAFEDTWSSAKALQHADRLTLTKSNLMSGISTP